MLNIRLLYYSQNIINKLLCVNKFGKKKKIDYNLSLLTKFGVTEWSEELIFFLVLVETFIYCTN